MNVIKRPRQNYGEINASTWTSSCEGTSLSHVRGGRHDITIPRF